MSDNANMTTTTQMVMISELRKVLKRLHYPLQVMLLCARWYAAYPLSLHHIEEMMQERGVFVDHATVHRWALKRRCCTDSQTRRMLPSLIQA